MINKKIWLQVAQSRNVEFPGLIAQINGVDGEAEFADWLKKYGSEDWLVYRNLWLHKGYQGEIDFLIVSRAKWVMIEVKNYDTCVSLGQNQSKIGDYYLDRNPIEQVQRSLGVLQRIAREIPFDLEIEAALVFINTHCQVVKTDACFGIPVYSRLEIRSFIQRLVAETRGSYFSRQQLITLQKVLTEHEVENPYAQVNLEKCDFSNMYRGFTCGECMGRDTILSHRHLHCNSCDALETKSQALVRMVHDYCILFQKDTFTRKEIYEFVGGGMRMDRITKIINKHFDKVKGFERRYFKI